MSNNETERVRRPAAFQTPTPADRLGRPEMPEVGVPQPGEVRWVARLTPAPTVKLAELLAMPLGLDVWERRADELVVAAGDAALVEVERRQLARVERISLVPEGAQPTGQDQGGDR